MEPQKDSQDAAIHQFTETTSRSIEWYYEGQARTVETEQFRVTVKLVGRKGRRCRIEIVAPAGALFRSVERSRS